MMRDPVLRCRDMNRVLCALVCIACLPLTGAGQKSSAVVEWAAYGNDQAGRNTRL